MSRSRLVIAISAAAVAMAVACGGPPAPSVAASSASAVRHAGSVGTFTSTPHTFSTNSFFIEGPGGLVLVDRQFTPSEAARFVDEAERATGKRATLAIVLHANPDKFNGTETLQKRGVRVVTSAQVNALVPDVFRRRTEAFSSRYAPDWPTRAPTPEVFGDKTTELDAAGTHLRLHVLGAGCSEAHVAVEWDGDDGKHVFVGDLVASGFHSWLELGKTDAWLARLAELRALGPRFVHPGRGPSGGVELLDAEERYLRDVVRLVDDEKPVSPAPDVALARVKEKLFALYPKHEFRVFLDIGLPAVWEARASGYQMRTRASEPR